MPNVVFFTDLSSKIVPLFTQYAPPDFTVHVCSPGAPEAEKCALAEEADFFILFPTQISETVLRATRHLKLIQLVGAGYDRMDLDLCRELGIPIANNGGANSIDVAEHTITLILGLYRRLLAMDNNVRSDQWRGLNSGLTTYTIHGKTAGIIGLGQIGQKVAQLLKAFGAEVIYYDAYPPAPNVEQALGVTRTALPDLLQQADIVTLHVPLTAETRALIGQSELALMKSSAILINTCRGPVVDEKALTQALSQDGIAGAGLDVLEQEPTDPNNPILALDNVLLTPHIAGVTYDTWSRRGKFMFQNIGRVWAGQPPLALVLDINTN